MKKLIKILFCFILIVSVLASAPAYANYNAVYEKSLTDSGDNPIYAGIYLMINLDNDTVIFEKDADKQTAPRLADQDNDGDCRARKLQEPRRGGQRRTISTIHLL